MVPKDRRSLEVKIVIGKTLVGGYGRTRWLQKARTSESTAMVAYQYGAATKMQQ